MTVCYSHKIHRIPQTTQQKAGIQEQIKMKSGSFQTTKTVSN